MTYRPLSLFATEDPEDGEEAVEDDSIQTYMQMNYEPQGENLKMDDYMMRMMRTQIMDNQDCTTQCVARCGRLAELPRTTSHQLTKCFENTCKCTDKSIQAELGEKAEDIYDMELLK